MQHCLYEFGYFQVESRIIDQYHHVRLIFPDIFLTGFHIIQDCSQVEQYGDKTHKSHLSVMLYQCAAYSLHQISPEETEIRLRVFFF